MSQEVKSENYETDISLNKINTIEGFGSTNKKITVPFWSENPNILFDQRYIFEFFPIDDMTYEQKLNAITRTVLVLTVLAFIFSKNLRIVIIGLITIGVIYLMHYYHVVEKEKIEVNKLTKEGFDNDVAKDYLSSKHIPIRSDIFQESDSSNPFSNVLMTDYDYNPNKKPAPPSFNENINKKILSDAKKLVVEANPDQPDIADKLFKDLGEQLVFEQSLRQFNSTANTTIPNDQGAFAEFCYGSMISCKEGNNFACARNMSHYTNY
jgi:Family of unknown function (DUF5762)